MSETNNPERGTLKRRVEDMEVMITDNKKPKIDLPHAPGPKLIYQSEICDFGTKLSYYISNEGNVKAFWEIPSFSHLRSKRPGKKVFKSP